MGACDDIKEIRNSISGNRQQYNNVGHETIQVNNTPENSSMAESIYGEEIGNSKADYPNANRMESALIGSISSWMINHDS